jgi:hypothetical protein
MKRKKREGHKHKRNKPYKGENKAKERREYVLIRSIQK